MKLKPSPIEIPADNPFKNDVVGRKPLIESLSSLVEKVAPPFVFCIDSPWGTGKTTFLELWSAHLKKSDVTTLYFNAWTTDFAPDPLVAFVSDISELVNSLDTSNKKRIKKLRKLGSSIAKRAIPVATKIATAGLVNSDDLTEESISGLAADLVGDSIKAYETQRQLSKNFRSTLEELIAKLPNVGTNPRLLVLVDELDRCRPPYALELLERIKHLFSVPNVIFALALDKRQLEASVRALYGSGIDSQDYLKKFIDLDVSLPAPSKPERFTEHLLEQFEFREIFSRRLHPAFQYDLAHLTSAFNTIAGLFSLSLRSREQCVSRLRVALLATPDNQHIYPDLLVLLTILRAAARNAYDRFASGHGSVTEILECLRSQLAGSQLLESHEGMLLEAFLIAAKQSASETVPELTRYEQIVSTAVGHTPEAQGLKSRAETITSFIREMRSRRHCPLLAFVVSKVELMGDSNR